MDLNRNQFFFLGIMVLLLGLQFRCVETYVLSQDATEFLAKRTGNSVTATSTSLLSISPGQSAVPRKVIQPPDWFAWCLISVGAVFVLHSLAMKRPV